MLSLLFALNICAQENTAILCADGIDNDNDGLIDCNDTECSAFIARGCDVCSEGISFADYVIEYNSGCPISDTFPEGALGIADYLGQVTDQPEFVFLGNTGTIKLGFSNNLVTNSGDDQLDIWIFEVGTLVEAITIGLRPKGDITIQILEDNNFVDPDGDGFYEITDIGGALSGIDIDDLIPGQLPETLLFDAIQITDIEDIGCIGSAPGADIDAVCAIFFVETDCNCVPNGTAIIDSCGVCLDPLDPEFNMEFNQSCLDCAGTLNGSAILDDCGVCLDPNNLEFNQSCLDCAGTVNGIAILDNCGVCLDPNSLEFNQSCLDCAGVMNGVSVFDDCNVCLDPSNPDFNRSCVDCAGVPNGNFEIDDCGNCLDPIDPNFKSVCDVDREIYIPNVIANGSIQNDKFQIFANDPSQILEVPLFAIYDRWGNLVYQEQFTDIVNFENWWDGTSNGKPLTLGCYVYKIEILFANNTTEVFIGDVTLIK